MKSNKTAQEIAEKASAIMHGNDHCAHSLGIRIDSVSPGSAIASMVVDQAYVNGQGYCQGGIITTLADTAFAHACNAYNQVTVAQGLTIEFVRSARVGERLVASATEQSRGRLTGVYQILVHNGEGKLVAIMTGKSFAREQTLFDE